MALYAKVVERRPWRHRTATVLVLGDIGRSPRMMYHAESLARSGWDTYMVGYGGAMLLQPELTSRYNADPQPTRDPKSPFPTFA